MNQGKSPKATVSVRHSSRRAGAERERLFHRLERFVNLGDDLGSLQAFGSECPTFAPVTFHDSRDPEARERPLAWKPEFGRVFLTFRNILREVWRTGAKAELGVLLGTNRVGTEILNRGAQPSLLHQGPVKGWQASLWEARKAIPIQYFTSPSEISPDWWAGTFRYEPDTEFRRAVYELFRQSWRARICPVCERYFIALKPPQRYCSTKCYGTGKRDRDLEFWRNVGSDRRKKRMMREKKS